MIHNISEVINRRRFNSSQLFTALLLLLVIAGCVEKVSAGTDTSSIDQVNVDEIDVGEETGVSLPSLPANKERIANSVSSMSKIELSTYDLVNRYRKTRNLEPLTADFDIAAQAKAHSEEMARQSNMSHAGFKDRVNSVSKTIVYRKASENVGYSRGYREPVLIVIEDWIGSLRHRKNILGSYDLTGIGVARSNQGVYYFTQIFVRKAWYVKDAD